MSYAKLFSPETPSDFPRLERLFDMSKRDFWDEATVIDWSQPLELPPEFRRPLAKILSIVYYGERCALEVAAQLIPLVNDEQAKFALSAQVIEEAKHVSVFRRLLLKLDEIHPVTLWSRIVLTDLVRTKSVAAKFIGMQLIVENFANHLFHHLSRVIPDPHVKQVLEYVERDEKKHTGLAALYLPQILARLPAREIPMLKARQVFWSGLLTRVVWQHREEAAVLGIDLHGAMVKGLASQQKIVENMGMDRGIWRSSMLEKIVLEGFQRLSG